MSDVTEKRMNLSALAEKYGSDKGLRAHKYTQLYDMLFYPFRDQPITFLEMGLQIGGPEHSKSADRETTDAPSARMWLEYFPKAEIIGLDVSDFSWLQADRWSFIRCDMDNRNAIREASEAAVSYDIIIDDASHASSHQQDAFLEFFPKLRSGGLYIIEDLQWQPGVYEKKKPGITKTAALFQDFLKFGEFRHAFEDTNAELNALAGDISGCFLFQKGFQKHLKDKVVVIHKA
ncbi:MAG: hypothetical protein AAF367_05970 [Pseudomonadota bacterium]